MQGRAGPDASRTIANQQKNELWMAAMADSDSSCKGGASELDSSIQVGLRHIYLYLPLPIQ